MSATQSTRWRCLHWLRCCMPPVHHSVSNSSPEPVPAETRSTERNTASEAGTGSAETENKEIGLESLIKDFSILEISQVAAGSDFSFSCSELPSVLHDQPIESFISRESIGSEEPMDCSLSLYEFLRTQQSRMETRNCRMRPQKPTGSSGKRDGRGRRYNPGASTVLADLAI